MMKTLTIRQVAAIKRVAQNTYALVQRKKRLEHLLESYNKEYEVLMTEIKGHETGVVNLTGYPSEAFVERVVGENKVVKWEPKAEALRYNKETKVYEVLLKDVVSLSEVRPEDIDTIIKEDSLKEGKLFENQPFPENVSLQEDPSAQENIQQNISDIFPPMQEDDLTF